jgi:hypothetical protein
MRRSRVLGLVVAIASPCLAVSAATAQAPHLDDKGKWQNVPATYTLACRGPLNVRIGLNSSPPIWMQFRRGRKPATSGVDPGTCAWMDRGVSDREADCLQHHTRDVSVQITVAAPAPPLAVTRPRNDMLIERPSGVTGKAAPPAPAVPAPAPAPVPPPTVVLSSLSEAKYLEFIATTNDRVAYFRAFSIAGSCMAIERTGA